MRNPALTKQRSLILAEIAVNSANTLILLALRSDETHSQEIIAEIEALIRAYLKADIGDEAIANNSNSSTEKLARLYQLNHRQRLILDYATTYLNVTIKNCEAMFPDVSRRTLQRDLKILSEKKLLLATGKTDQRRYCLNFDSLN